MGKMLAELKESLALEMAYEKVKDGDQDEAMTTTLDQTFENFHVHVDSAMGNGP